MTKKIVDKHYKETITKLQGAILDPSSAIVVPLDKPSYQLLGLAGTRLSTGVGDTFECDAIPGVTCVKGYSFADVAKAPSKMLLLQQMFYSLQSMVEGHDWGDITYLDTPDQLQSFLDSCAELTVAFDIETTGLDPSTNNVLCASFYDGTRAAYVSLEHPDTRTMAGIKRRMIAEWWTKGPRIAHNAKFEQRWMRSVFGAKLDMDHMLHDSMQCIQLFNENMRKGLKHHVIHTLRRPAYWEAVPSGTSEGWDRVPLRKLGHYCVKDSIACYDLWEHFYNKLTDKQKDLYETVCSAQIVLSEMENQGIKVDNHLLEVVTAESEDESFELNRLMESSFPGVNIKSTKQMRELLYTTLNLPVKDTTATDLPSTSAGAIVKLARQEPKLLPIVEARRAKDYLTREVLPLADLARTGYVHTTYNMCRTSTGRLSSSDPNLQNVGRDAPHRKCFVSRFDGGKIVQIDYAQHELRTFAEVVGCASLQAAFSACEDPHQKTADVMNCGRHQAKTANFSLLYGAGVRQFAAMLGVDERTASTLRTAWHNAHPEVQEYYDACLRQAKAYGYVQAASGRRRHLADMNDTHQQKQAYNAPIQGYAHDLLMQALVGCQIFTCSQGLRSKVMHEVHDAIYFDVHPEEMWMIPEMAEIMVMQTPDNWASQLATDVTIKEHM